jgi:hypothetical protein
MQLLAALTDWLVAWGRSFRGPGTRASTNSGILKYNILRSRTNQWTLDSSNASDPCTRRRCARTWAKFWLFAVPPRSKSMAWKLKNRISSNQSHRWKKAWRRRRIFICVSPQECANAPDAGATRYFVAIFITYVNFSFHASAKKTSMSQNLSFNELFGPSGGAIPWLVLRYLLLSNSN